MYVGPFAFYPKSGLKVWAPVTSNKESIEIPQEFNGTQFDAILPKETPCVLGHAFGELQL